VLLLATQTPYAAFLKLEEWRFFCSLQQNIRPPPPAPSPPTGKGLMWGVSDAFTFVTTQQKQHPSAVVCVLTNDRT
jgi:hypothetical protein